MAKTKTRRESRAGKSVLLTLATGQFVMALDTTVMNTAIATVAKDLGTTVTGIQTAITLYTLVMASLMITGGKLGEMLGRKRAFSIGCVVYACGSLTTALAPNLVVLIIGWSFLEGLGAVLIMPAIVALVASNFGKPERPRAYGLVAAAGAIAAALGPVIGGAFTTYASWRWVFAGEVLIVLVILVLVRRVNDTPAEEGTRLDLGGTAMSALGLGMIVLGVLVSGSWGFVQPKPGAPTWLGLSPGIWLVLAGGVMSAAFLAWEKRRVTRHESGLVDPALLRVRQLRSGVGSFLFMFLVQAGVFFTIPLFLSVALGLSAVETGIRLLPLSLMLLLFAVGIPKLRPDASPRRVVRLGFVAVFAGIVLLVVLLDVSAGPKIITWPLLLTGAGLGALASQLGSVTVSSVPDEMSGQVGGLQNTGTQLGASIGTALAGAVVISALTASFFAGIQDNPDVPADLASQAQTQLSSGVPILSDNQLRVTLDNADVPPATADAVVATNAQSRIAGLRSALAVLAMLTLLALVATGGIPREQPGARPKPTPPPG
ncbi:MFS transporter [Amycolatopsis carbonis]|uniref:MFS transporter n=1 Tax=Amycolatopsis carbonis TaxID=715471 RepID=A0A9Y2IBX8_9PSEU|nr:MFS transporter [Amycolatopsis sp. 2-15]WIX75553.1 MFS transporter [Amycolatopsis sp. 2-15]